jgi:hypothetical protein
LFRENLFLIQPTLKEKKEKGNARQDDLEHKPLFIFLFFFSHGGCQKVGPKVAKFLDR